MDRLKEFNSIVLLTEVPQNHYEKIPFCEDIKALENEIERGFADLSKITAYESFKGHSLINKLSEMLNEYKKSEIIGCDNSRDGQEVVSNLKSMINTKFLKYTLKLNELKRRSQKEIQIDGGSNNAPKTAGNGQLLQEEQEFRQKEDSVQERKRIIKSINEIGQIVEDISIHVRLQEEQLKRIDDIVIESEGWSKKALGELNDIWLMVKSNRKFIIKFFVFWLFIILIFWMLKKI